MPPCQLDFKVQQKSDVEKVLSLVPALENAKIIQLQQERSKSELKFSFSCCSGFFIPLKVRCRYDSDNCYVSLLQCNVCEYVKY